VAAEVVADFAARSGCASTDDAACVDTFLRTAARRAFHGTLDESDAAILTGIGTDLGDVDSAIVVQTQIEFILSSPRFLYLVEFGGAGTTMAPLSGGEVAGRLAAFLWRSVPDAALLAAADSGALTSPPDVRAHVLTMLEDARALPALESFANEWLRISSASPDAPALDQQIFAQPGDVMAQAATNPAFLFDDLLAGNSAPLGSELAGLYGAALDGNGVAALPDERRGLLLSAAFLRSNSSGSRASPVKRGFIVRRSLLCETIPPPEDPLAMQLPQVTDGVTEQQAFSQHSADPNCSVCHQYMDPLGNAFSTYDALGQYDASLATDTGGTIIFGSEHEPPEMTYADTQAFLELLSTDSTPKQCFVLQTLRFALGRGETAADACGVEGIVEGLGEAMSVQELLIQIATSPQFLNRNPVVAGGTCR
jgi:hypothetical protein